MSFDNLEFIACELSGLSDDAVRNRGFSDVVEQAAESQDVELRFRIPHPDADGAGDQCDVDAVGVSGIVNLAHIVKHVEHGYGRLLGREQRRSLREQQLRVHRLSTEDKIIQGIVQKIRFLVKILPEYAVFPAAPYFLRVSGRCIRHIFNKIIRSCRVEGVIHNFCKWYTVKIHVRDHLRRQSGVFFDQKLSRRCIYTRRGYHSGREISGSESFHGYFLKTFRKINDDTVFSIYNSTEAGN